MLNTACPSPFTHQRSFKEFDIIQEKADTEWKFARSKLWISYFEEGGRCSLYDTWAMLIVLFTTAAFPTRLESMNTCDLIKTPKQPSY